MLELYCYALCHLKFITWISHNAFIFDNIRDAALTIVWSDEWEKAVSWRAENDKYGCYTTMKLLIKHMPGKIILYSIFHCEV